MKENEVSSQLKREIASFRAVDKQWYLDLLDDGKQKAYEENHLHALLVMLRAYYLSKERQAVRAAQKEMTALRAADDRSAAAYARTLELNRVIAAARARMDTGKLLLAARQAEISAAFAAAEQAVLALDRAGYARFVFALLDRYAEAGDTVVVPASQREKVTEKDVADYAEKRGMPLSYRADGQFSGGVILENEKYDKNLTLSMLLQEYREGHEAEVAAILAGE